MKLLFLFHLFLVLCSCSNIIVYYPEKISYAHPRDYDINFENLFLNTSDGIAIHAWWLTPKDQNAKATILHFHSSEKNISYHLDDSRRLVEEGYNVLTFDYRGYGHSDGYPHKFGLMKDGVAAIDFLYERDDIDLHKIIIFAQAEGAPVALAALTSHGIKPAAIVFDNPMYSYKKVTEDTVGSIPLGKLVSWPASLAAGLQDYDPQQNVKSTFGIPILICHSEENRIIRSEHSLSLYKEAVEPKTLYLTDGGGHLNMLKNMSHCQKIVSFIDDSLAKIPAAVTQQESPQE